MFRCMFIDTHFKVLTRAHEHSSYTLMILFKTLVYHLLIDLISKIKEGKCD